MKSESRRAHRLAGIITSAAFVVTLASCGSTPLPSTTLPPSSPNPSIEPAASPGAATGGAGALPPIADVPFYKVDASRSGDQPGPGPLTKPVQAWSHDVGCPVAERTAVIGSGILLLGCDANTLTALDARTGSPRWTASLTGRVKGSAAIADGVVYVSTDDESFHALDLTSGNERWSQKLPANGSPALVAGTIYVGTTDGRFVGMSPQDGSITWSWKAPGAAGGTVVGDTAYVGVDDGVLYAISLADKTERWHLAVRSGHVSSPAIDGPTVYVGSLQEGDTPNGELYAIDASTGTVRWTFRTTSGLQVGAPIVRDGVVYMASQDQGLIALDAKDGHIKWQAKTEGGFVPAAATSDAVYVASVQSLAGFRASDGTTLWHIDLPFPTASSPVVSGGMLFIGDAAGHVDAYAEPELAMLIPSPAQSSGPSAAPPSASLAVTFDLTATFTSGLDGPAGMDLGPDGNLYVVNSNLAQIVVLSPDGKIVRKWGTKGTGPGQLDFFRGPGDATGGLGVDGDGNVYVGDLANRRVEVFTAAGTFVRQWGRFGDGDGQFLEPFDVDIAPDGSVYVVDDTHDDIQKFDPTGKFLARIGRHGTGPGELNYTGGIGVGPDGTLYNGDFSNGRAQAWDADGHYLWTLGGQGTAPGQFENPRDVAVDSSGRIYVVDEHRVQVFDTNRNLVGTWATPGPTLAAVAIKDKQAFVSAIFDNQIFQLTLKP